MSDHIHFKKDLTRWNRAGLNRFDYVDGDAATWLEELRIALVGLYMRGEQPEHRTPDAWRDLWLDETDPDRRDGLDLEGMAAKVVWDRIAPKAPRTPKALETRGQRAQRLLEQYAQEPNGDHAWEILRAFARASHVLTGHMNAYANEGYLRTATQWDNLRRIAALVNYQPNPPASASTLIALALKPAAGVVEILPGLAMEFAPDDGGAPLVFETSAPVLCHPDLNAAPLVGWQNNATPLRITDTNLRWHFPEKQKLSTGDLVVFTDGHAGIASTVTALVRSEDVDEIATISTDAEPSAPSIRTDMASLLTEAEAVRVGLPRPYESLYEFHVSPKGLDLKPGDLVRLKNDGFDGIVALEEAEGSDFLVRTHKSFAGVLFVKPLTAIDPKDTETLNEALRSGTSIMYPTVGGIKRLAARANETDLMHILKGSNDGLLSDLVYLESDAQSEAEKKKEESDPYVAHITGVSFEVIDDSAAARSIVQFAGKPPKTLTTGTWIIARHETGTRSTAHRVGKITTGANSFSVHFPSPIETSPEKTEFHGPMKTPLLPVDYNRNPAPAFTSDARTINVQGVSQDAVSALRPGRAMIISDTRIPNGSADVEATLTNITISADDRVNLAFEPAKSLSGFTVGDTRICLNAVTATHGETKGPKTLGSGDGEFGAQSFVLEVPDITHIPSAQAVSGVVPDLIVSIDNERWDYRDSSDLAADGTQSFSTTLGDDGFLRLHFRRRLPTGTNNISVSRHRVGTGARGNLVPTVGFNKPMRKHPHVARIYQPFPTSGGAGREPVESLRQAVPSRLVTNGRAVSLKDFERLAQGHASVLRAFADERPTASRFRDVAITIVPAGGATLTSGLIADIDTMIKTHAIPGLRLGLSSYGPVYLKIAALIRADLTVIDKTDLLAAAQTALKTYFSLESRTFGQITYVAEVLAALEQVPGVTTAQVTTFDYVRQTGGGGQSPSRTARRDNVIAAIYPKPTQVAFLSANGAHLSLDVKGETNG